jgi:imidazolonepropionase-like amidohydrolase
MRKIPTALTGAFALVGTDLEPMENVTVLLDSEHIAAVGRHDDVPIPEGAEIVHLEGATLTPGFIDAHVHIGFVDPADVLAGGVTTVRDLGWPPHEIHASALASRDPSFDGPEILAVGPILTAVGGYPSRAAWAPEGTARELAGRKDAIAAVERTADEGAVAIKIALNPPVGPTLDPDTLRAVVQAAHDRQLRVTGHIYGTGELAKAVDAGVDEMAHWLMSDEDVPESLLDRMVQKEMTVVPTLSIRPSSELGRAARNLEAFRTRGGRVVYGTDLGNAGPKPGIDRLEIEGMRRAGFSIMDIVRCATAGAAEYLGLGDRGSLEAGKLADIVAFDGPLATTSDLPKVAHVWRRGLRRSP